MKATLTYHSIDDSGSAISVSPKAFQAHLDWLVSGRVRVLPLEEIVTHPADGEDAVAVTFDDAFLNARGAVESLLNAGVPVTLFVVSGHVGGTNAWGGLTDPRVPTWPLLGWDDLDHLVARGAVVAPHTRHHPALTTVTGDALDDELLGSLADLDARLGMRSAHLAYPYGEVDDVVEMRATAYFRFGHTTDFGFIRKTDPAMRLPRLDMYYFQAPGSLEAWGAPAFARRVAWCRARRMIRSRLFDRWTPRGRGRS